jgi:uncharacterized protein
MKLNDLSAKDKVTFAKYLDLSGHDLSVYAFENIYIWKGLFDIKWQIINDSLCVFFKDNIGTFLYLAPLAKENSPAVIDEVFSIMDKQNKNKDISRIENAEEKDIPFYRNSGFDCSVKAHDYLCSRTDLAQLKGNKFKSKRAAFNFFTKHYDFKYAPFSRKDKAECLKLYQLWMNSRKDKSRGPIYNYMLQDSRSALKEALNNLPLLKLTGRVVRIKGKIKGFTFGFPLNKDVFCVLFEITDLSVKGLAQFIFARFCKELKDYKHINIMDDSGLENLKQVKLSYYPLKLIPGFIVKRKSR